MSRIKIFRYGLAAILLLLLLNWLFELLVGLVLFGIYDVSRNKGLSAKEVRQYFIGNGTFTWLLSPINTFFDLIALPHFNQGIYELEDLPAEHQAEIREVLSAGDQPALLADIREQLAESQRGMLFFRWYGRAVPCSFNVPALQKDYSKIKTIGISVFNQGASTGKHFGPLRPTFRVLYNLNQVSGRESFIEVGDTLQRWCDEPLFIFDDTLLHRSVNEIDEVRYCLFIDIVRPSGFPRVMDACAQVCGLVFMKVNAIFYKKWVPIR